MQAAERVAANALLPLTKDRSHHSDTKREWLIVSSTKSPEFNSPVPYDSLALENAPEVPPRKRELLDSIVNIEFPPSVDERLALRIQRAIAALDSFVEVVSTKCGGVPVLRGTRFTVSQLLAQFADGDSLKDLVQNLDLDEDQVSGLLHAMAVILDRPPSNEAGST